MNSTGEKTNRRMITKIIVIVLITAFMFLGVFFLYDSPAKYVTTQDGTIYIKSDGNPVLYYTDLFGNTFSQDDGKRVYIAVPVYVDVHSENTTIE